VKDHLGSVRVTVDEAGNLVSYDDYYPYGLQMPGRSLTSGLGTKEGYTGHELDDETGLLYAGARYYDPVIARWQAIDPLADEYPGWSPYNYVLGNPLALVDPDGRAADCPSCDRRIDHRVKRYLSGDISRGQYVQETTLGLSQIVGATGDFVRNYWDMREANTIGADKYFHCKANCEATQRGEVGEDTATIISDLRELFDRLFKGDPEEASEADQEANRHGRDNANAGECTEVCQPFKPDALDTDTPDQDTSEEENQ